MANDPKRFQSGREVFEHFVPTFRSAGKIKDGDNPASRLESATADLSSRISHELAVLIERIRRPSSEQDSS